MRLSRFSFVASLVSVLFLTVGQVFASAAAVFTELIHVAFPAAPQHLLATTTVAPARSIGLPQTRSFRSLFLARSSLAHVGPALA